MPPVDDFQLDRSFTHRLHTLSKLTDRLTQQAYAKATGLPLGEGRCLAAVGAFGPISVNELAAYANLNKGQASRAAQALVDRGLVQKEAVLTDARSVVLRLSAAGQAVWATLRTVIACRNEAIVSSLTLSERASLDALLDRLVTDARAQSVGNFDEEA
jgi:DNA-binding MarR family transcriptional regulator